MMNQAMIRKARQLQKEMIETQKEIEETNFTANCGPVSVTMLGSKVITNVKIDKTFRIEDESDAEILEDSIVAASNQIIQEINAFTEEKMSKYKAFLGGAF